MTPKQETLQSDRGTASTCGKGRFQFSLRALFLAVLLWGAVPLVAPLILFGSWLPDFWRGPMTLAAYKSTNSPLHYKFCQEMNELWGHEDPFAYDQWFVYTRDGQHWFSVTFGIEGDRIWACKMDHAQDHSTIKLFDASGKVRVSLKWFEEHQKYLRVNEDGTLVQENEIANHHIWNGRVE